jgi:hypothetical protein
MPNRQNHNLVCINFNLERGTYTVFDASFKEQQLLAASLVRHTLKGFPECQQDSMSYLYRAGGKL